ncbi:unnamed protein product [Gongylonema pulchrum]|uniref:DUF1741 domain-containing protein n=1 Tax=Gongylonema pulchrum TaxID=637853 RepID=A0A183DQ90_9BILA|nr:unnamed protein product [Gongylonema pulchrum]
MKITKSILHLINLILKGANAQKVREQAELVAKLYDESLEKNPVTYRFLLKNASADDYLRFDPLSGTNSRFSNEPLFRLLKAIEVCRDEFTTLLLCRILMGFVTQCGSSASEVVRQKLIIRMDGTNSLIRCFLSYFRLAAVEGSVVDILTSLLIMLAQQARNARMFGKSEKFVTGILAAIVDGAMDASVVARLMEMLFFIIKFRNRAIMSLLESQSIFSVLLRVFDEHFQQRFVAPAHLEICAFAVTSLSNLARLRCHREHLVSADAQKVFQSAMLIICKDVESVENLSPLTTSFAVEFQVKVVSGLLSF